MQPMFGAPIGTMAAQTQEAANLKASLGHLQQIGELEQVPGKMAYIRALTGQADAVAGEKRQEASDLAQLAEYERVAAQVAGAEGRDADVTDVRRARETTLTPLRRLYDVMVQKGAPSRMLLPLADKMAKIASSEGTAAFNEGRAVNEALESEQRVNEQIGSLAQVAIDSPQGYAQARLMAAQSNLPPPIQQLFDSLPQDWKAGQAILRPLTIQALKLKDAMELKQKETKLKSDLATAETTRARNVASAAVANTRLGLVREQTNVLKKLGGEGAPTTQAATEALIEQRRLTNEAKQLALYPRAPVDPSKRKPGVFYTLPNGRVGRIVVGPDGGQAVELMPATKPPRTADQIRTEQLRRARLGGLNTDLLEEEED